MSFFLGILPIAPVAVATGSMEPAIGVGDVVVVCRTDPDTLQVGDVIRYRLDGYTVIHRIVERQDGADGQAQAFITQGDNNNGPDSEPVSPEQIMGRVILTVPNAKPLYPLASQRTVGQLTAAIAADLRKSPWTLTGVQGLFPIS